MATPSEAIEPIGDLSVALFPGQTDAGLQAMVAHWITDAASQIPNTIANTAAYERAVLAWVYYRAYRLVTIRLSRDPASMTLAGEGSATITGEQVRTFKTLADGALATFNTAIASAGDAVLSEGASGSVPNSYVF